MKPPNVASSFWPLLLCPKELGFHLTNPISVPFDDALPRNRSPYQQGARPHRGNPVWSKNSNGMKWRGLGFCTGSVLK